MASSASNNAADSPTPLQADGLGVSGRFKEEDELDVTKEEDERYASDGRTDMDGRKENPPSENTPEKPKTKSKIAVYWAKLELDVPTVLMMMKAGLPPTIALAMYRSTAVAKTYTTLGYLVAIVSIFGFCIMPRAKFIQTMIMNIIVTCFGGAICMLMLWSGVQARHHTTPLGRQNPYNSSQSAVMGIWLFFQIWLVNSIKAKFPQFALPTILYSIFVNVAASYGTRFTATAQAQTFVEKLLYAFLTGFALATGVSLIVLPVTCRKVVTKQMTGYLSALRAALQAHQNYLQSLENTDVFDQRKAKSADDKKKSKKAERKPEIEAIKTLGAKFGALHGKLHGDLPFAKREIAYGKMKPDDFEAMFKHLREIMMPIVGLSSLMDLFDRTAEKMHWGSHSEHYENDKEVENKEELHRQAVEDWNEIMKSVHEPIKNIIQSMDGGLQHIMLRFALTKPPKKKKGTTASDEEAKGELIQPGDDGYTEYLEKQSMDFYNGRDTTLREWISRKGIKVREGFFTQLPKKDEPIPDFPELTKQPSFVQNRNQRQLYVLLYIVFLLHSISQAIIRFAKFADERDQAKAKSQFIYPNKKRFRKWIHSMFNSQDANNDDEATLVGLERNGIVVYMGEAFKDRKDPEHLPPANAWEKLGDFIRGISKFLRSPESSFGFRVACATMTIAIIAFLRDTQIFFIQQRLVWALIMVAISMTPTVGQSVWEFALRIIGTIIAMIVAWLIWYIPGQKTAGIIVFVWVFVSIGFYVPLKRPDLLIVGLIGVVTATMIVGYELQVRKIGVELSTSNGQPAYAIHILGPYRLACVVGGLAVAFIWTFFPFPISEHSALRQKLGGSLYLSANYYSIIHETVMARVRGDEGDHNDPKSPAASLLKARNKVFAKQMLLLQGLKAHSSFVRWELPFGGKFPREEYDQIIQLIQNITNYTALLSFASENFTKTSRLMADDPSASNWFNNFCRIVEAANVTSHEATSLLALLSSSITTGQPLPPYLSTPHPYELSRTMKQIDDDILSVRHIAEPGYAAFAVLQISTSCINMDLEKLLKAVKKLVGELDFSFHIVSTQSSSATSSSDTLTTTTRDKQD